MVHLLDTNVAIHLRDGDVAISAKIATLNELVISVITRVELEGGVYRDPALTQSRRANVDALLEAMTVLPFDDNAADAYRSIVQSAGYSRRKVADRMIAAQALAAKATLVTMNAGDFRDVPGLTLLEW